MKTFASIIIFICLGFTVSAQCLPAGSTDNSDPYLTSMTFTSNCISDQGEEHLIIDWIFGINLVDQSPNDDNQLKCQAPAGSWGIMIEFPEFMDAYQGAPFTFGNLDDIENGDDFNWSWDVTSKRLIGVNRSAMNLDLIQAEQDPNYQAVGGEIRIPVIMSAQTNCTNEFSYASIFLVADDQGGCTHVFNNKVSNDTQESSAGTMSAGPPPVEYSIWKIGNRSCHSIFVEWETVFENDNDGFEVQRKIGSSGQFNRIAWVEGKGTTAEKSNYSYRDDLVSKHFGKDIFYRLKQHSFDGEITYSEVIKTRLDCALLQSFVLFPNPVTTSIKIDFHGEQLGKAKVVISNSLGQIVKSFEHSNIKNQELDLSELGSGLYELSVLGLEGQVLAKDQFVKLN